MRILITTGLSEKDIGGPFQYATKLEEEFKSLGHEVRVAKYGSVEKKLPLGLRHIYFFLKVFPMCLWSGQVLTLDTFSVGVPTVLATKMCGKKCIVRVGGDFLWSAYVNRTSEPFTLPAFYSQLPKLNVKEKLILFFTRCLIRTADFLSFNTEWQKGIWNSFYGIPENRSGIVRNFISEKNEGELSATKNFLWAGRIIPEKNLDLLKKLGRRLTANHPEVRFDIVTGESFEQVLGRARSCYVAVSLAFSDICPNFILEAVSYGKPFIMTRETGFHEIYPKGGIFIDPLDIREVEAAMETMIDNKHYDNFVAELKGSDPRHSWREMAEEYIDIWKNL